MAYLDRPLHFSIPGVKAYLVFGVTFDQISDYVIQDNLNNLYCKHYAKPDLLFCSEETRVKLMRPLFEDVYYRMIVRSDVAEGWRDVYPNKITGGYLKIVVMPGLDDNTIQFGSWIDLKVRYERG